MNELEKKINELNIRITKLEQLEKRRMIFKTIMVILTIIITIVLVFVYIKIISSVLLNIGGSL